jgi:hypothetical protein
VTIEELLDYTFEVLGKDNRHIQSLSFVSDSRVTTPLLTEGPRLRWEVNQAFLDLEREEIKFALLHATTPRPSEIRSIFWPGILLTLVFFGITVYSVMRLVSGGGPQWLIGAIGVFPTTNWILPYAREAAHLDQVIAITKDPISARSYLVKVHGDRHVSWIQRLNRRKIHPIRAYIRYGKDERVKAILKSDLVHPTQLEKHL